MSEGLHPAQVAALRKMTPARRLELGLQFIGEMRQLKAAALHAQHPDWSAAQVAEALRRFTLHART